MEEVAASGKSSDAGSGCNYQPSSVEDADAAVSSADLHAHLSSGMLHQHQHLHHAHQLLSEQGRLLPPQYASLTSLNNNNLYSADGDNVDDTKYPLTAASLLCQAHHPYHNHSRYQLDNHHYHHHHQQQQQQPSQFQLDYCNAMSAGQSYGMTSSSSSVSGCGSVTSRTGYCGRGQFDVVSAAAAAYSAGEPRPNAMYWTTSCGVGVDQQRQPADIDDPADVKPTLLDASSYLVPAGSYPARQHGYVPSWYPAPGYGWGVPPGSDPTGGYYPGSSVYNEASIMHTSSPPMHHILRGVYNTLQVRQRFASTQPR